jgi:hypothetical protein
MEMNNTCGIILIYRLYRKSPYMENFSLYREISFFTHPRLKF